MTREELKKLLGKVQIAYPRFEIIKDSETLDVWFECTEYMDYSLAQQAIINSIKRCEFPPNIADFCKDYDVIKEEYDHKLSDIKLSCRNGNCGFPHKGNPDKEDREAWEIFHDLTIGLTGGDMDKALIYASELCNKCRRDFSIMEADEEKRKNFPSYVEYLSGVKEELSSESKC